MNKSKSLIVRETHFAYVHIMLLCWFYGKQFIWCLLFEEFQNVKNLILTYMYMRKNYFIMLKKNNYFIASIVYSFNFLKIWVYFLKLFMYFTLIYFLKCITFSSLIELDNNLEKVVSKLFICFLFLNFEINYF